VSSRTDILLARKPVIYIGDSAYLGASLRNSDCSSPTHLVQCWFASEI